MEELDCDGLFVDDDFSFLENGILFDVEPPVLSDSSPTESVSSWIGQIESLLMKDDDQDHQNLLDTEELPISDFLADILVDSPGDSGSVDKESDDSRIASPEKEIADVSIEKELVGISDDSGNGSPEKEIASVLIEKKFGNLSGDSGNGSPEKESADNKEINKDADDTDDPASKKIRRQLRNRDAAVRSRERKKMYLKDLETKSRYLERECMRLGRLLQCFVAENQALRFSLQKCGNPYDASMAKQESAVLFWESLLLVSLLWSLGIMCLFPQPPRESSRPETVTKNGREDEARREGGNKTTYTPCSVMGRRCVGSKTRMKTKPPWTTNPCVS